MNVVERGWFGFRRVVGRILRPINGRRSGYFFAYRRTAVEWTTFALMSWPTRVDVEGVDLTTVPARVRGAELHEVVPAEVGATPVLESVRAQSVAVIPDGVVFGTSGWSGTHRTRVVVSPSQTMWPWPSADRRRSVAESRDAPEVWLPGTTVNLRHPGFDNYAHFMLQTVPRLECIRRVVSGRDVDRVLIPDPSPRFVFEVLERIGIEPDQIFAVPGEPPVVYRCERLVAATVLDTLEVGAPWAAASLRVPYADEIASRGNRRLYLAHEAGLVRRIVNERAVVSLLEASGFDVVSLAGLTVAEQATLIASAECVVGLHGAALANWIFAHPGTRVIELLPANVARSMYEQLAGRLGLKYRASVGTEPSPPGRLRRFLIDSDTSVDVVALAGLLDWASVS